MRNKFSVARGCCDPVKGSAYFSYDISLAYAEGFRDDDTIANRLLEGKEIWSVPWQSMAHLNDSFPPSGTPGASDYAFPPRGVQIKVNGSGNRCFVLCEWARGGAKRYDMLVVDKLSGDYVNSWFVKDRVDNYTRIGTPLIQPTFDGGVYVSLSQGSPHTDNVLLYDSEGDLSHTYKLWGDVSGQIGGGVYAMSLGGVGDCYVTHRAHDYTLPLGDQFSFSRLTDDGEITDRRRANHSAHDFINGSIRFYRPRSFSGSLGAWTIATTGIAYHERRSGFGRSLFAYRDPDMGGFDGDNYSDIIWNIPSVTTVGANSISVNESEDRLYILYGSQSKTPADMDASTGKNAQRTPVGHFLPHSVTCDPGDGAFR